MCSVHFVHFKLVHMYIIMSVSDFYGKIRSSVSMCILCTVAHGCIYDVHVLYAYAC